jgi:hypothetical protein
VSASGHVSVRRPSSAELAARAGLAVIVGDTVITGAQSSAKLLVRDQSILDLGPSTELRIEAFEDADSADRRFSSSIDFGQVRAAVNKKLGRRGHFQMRTKSSVMAVRGTEFVIASQLSPASGGTEVRTKVTVMEGQVEVLAPQAQAVPRVMLSPNRSLQTTALLQEVQGRSVVRLAGGTLGQVTPLTPEQTSEVVRRASVEDRLFSDLVVLGSNPAFGGGRSTLGFIATRVALPPGKALHPGDLMTPGGFSPLDVHGQTYSYSAATPVNIRVVIGP